MALLYRMGTGNGSGGDLKPYTVNFECANGYIGQTLTMTYQGTPHAGEVVDNVSGTVGSDGTLTLYPMHSGIWECSCYSSVTGTTTIKTIDLSYWGIQPTVTFEDIPNGATVTPTDDIQTWLKCANLNKSYTTISQVLADTNTLSALISDNNASDYLVRSTTWASDVCSNESAMTYIGLNDYCAWSLLDNDTWNEAICNSKYFEKVLNVHLDILNSSSTEATHGGGAIQNVVGQPYEAFDNDESTFWFVVTANDTTPRWLQYKSDKLANVIMKKAIVIGQNGHPNADIQDITLYRNNDIQLCDTFKIADAKQTDKKTSIVFDNNKVGKSDTYKLVSSVVLAYSTYYYAATIKELQFYGRERV